MDNVGIREAYMFILLRFSRGMIDVLIASSEFLLSIVVGKILDAQLFAGCSIIDRRFLS